MDEIIKFAVGIEMSQETVDNVSNYEEVKKDLVSRLERLRDVKNPHKY